MILPKPLSAFSWPALCLAFAALTAAPTPSQGTAGTDVGLAISGAGLRFGVVCGPFQCSYVRGTMPAGARATLTAFGPPRTPFAIGISPPTNNCRRVPGILNGLLLGRPIITHAVGIIGSQSPNTLCRQGMQNVPLGIPPRLSGLMFAVQSIGLDSMSTPFGGPVPAFSNPILVAVP